MPPTNGINPWWRLRKLGLSTKPTFFATFRAKNRNSVVNKKILMRSVLTVSKFTMRALRENYKQKYNHEGLYSEGKLHSEPSVLYNY